MMTMRFLVYLEPDEDGGYVVSVPSLPGCVSQGETVEEALEMIRDAIAGYIATLKAHGQPIPHGVEQGQFEVVEVMLEPAL
ncbi:MAG: type II toxin-antitoxin system HicB family antitoxin [Fimbriimonadales bacterium]|nr:type II toxin-antitoxin system HicB family antitoxin [Fimbriimonadales bacterium]